MSVDYPVGAPIESMTFVGTTMVAAIDNGAYGASTLRLMYGVSLAVIDPTMTPNVSVAFELPAQVGAQSKVAGIDMAPQTLSIARKLPHAVFAPLKTGAARL